MEISPYVYDRQNTLPALNMAVVAVKTIVSSEDRIVLEQQYRTIIDRLKFGSIESDDELIRFHEDLLNGITGCLLAQDERERFTKAYDREQKRIILTALKGTLTALPLAGDFTWLAMARILMRGASAFFGYAAAKKRLSEELDDNLWHLGREQVRRFDALQRGLLRTTWSLLRKYGLSDDVRVTQENLEYLEKALRQPDPALACYMFGDLKTRFAAYPPFWFYYGEAALQSGDLPQAEACFAEFDYVDRDVLRFDPYKVQIAKYRIMTRTNPSLDYVKRQLAVIEEHASQWLDYLFLGVMAFAVGEKEKAINAVRHNMAFGLETEISAQVLTAMEQGTQLLWAALAHAYHDGKGVEADTAAACKYAYLARLYGDTSVDGLIKQIEGTGGLFGFGKKAELDPAAVEAARAEARRLFDEAQQAAERQTKQLTAADDETAARERAEREETERKRREREDKEREERAERLRKEAAQREQDAKDAAERQKLLDEQRERTRLAQEAAQKAQKEAHDREEQQRLVTEKKLHELEEQLEKERAARQKAERDKELLDQIEREKAAQAEAERLRKEAEQRAARQQQEAEERACKLKEQIEQERRRAEAVKAGAVGGALSVGAVGSTVAFGRYPQTKGGAVQPIEWLVLANEGGKVLLISKYGLDAKPYHKNYVNITWERCTLRAWLNGEFLNSVFNDGERGQIVQVRNQNLYNGLPGGNATDDKVFLLCKDQAWCYFKNDEARQCRPTEYASGNGAYVSDNGCCWWWLRSPSDGCSRAAGVNDAGTVYGHGNSVGNDYLCVRPALWVSNL